MNSTANTALIAYVASPHAGYLKLFRMYEGSILYVLGNEFIQQFPPLVRNLPGVTPEESRKMIQSLCIFREVRVLTLDALNDIDVRQLHIVMPDEDVSHALANKYFAGRSITFDDRWKLRWDWGATQKNRQPDGERVVSVNELDRELMRGAFREARRSPDLWRQIGALLVEDGNILLAAFNRHVPSDQSAYIYGDPRSNFEQGDCIEVSGASHAERGLLAEVARRGFSTYECDLYVTMFPCPPCAYQWAYTGIKRLFYVDGYSLIAGAETLQANNVEIIRVEMR